MGTEENVRIEVVENILVNVNISEDDFFIGVIDIDLKHLKEN